MDLRHAWRRPARTLGLAERVFAGTAGVVVVVLAAALLATSLSIRQAGDAAAQRGLEQAADLVAQFLAGRQRALAGGTRVFAQEPYLRALVASARRDDVLDRTFEAAQQLGADWVFITDGSGRLLAKSDEPGASGDALGGRPLVATALHGQVASGFGVSRDSLLFQAVAVPVAVPGGVPVGALIATKVVDARLAHDVRAATAAEVVFYVIDARGGARVAATSFERRDVARSALTAVAGATAMARRAGRDGRAPVSVAGIDYLAQGSAATTAGGETVGGFVVLRRLDLERAELAGVQRSLLAAGAVGLLLALGAAWLTARRITRPVRLLADAARRAAEGDYRANDVLRAAGLTVDDEAARAGVGIGDEIDALGAAFGSLLTDLRDRVALDRAALGVVRALEPGHRTAPVGSPRGAPQGPPSVRAARTLSLPRAAGGAAGPGTVLAGRYLLETMLGAGGSGVVWRARDRELDEIIAVKILRPELAAMDPEALDRFRDELRLARRLTHRNVVRLHDLGRDGATAFLTMEYVDGASLAALLAAHGPLPAPAVLSVAKQLTRALDVAHEQGVVHGDLKPANLLLGAGGVLKVTDFGLARLIRAPSAPGSAAPDIAGALVGTPAYMAPELLLGAAPSVASDLYAAGVVLHACLTGVTPFDDDTPVAFFARKLDTPSSALPQPVPVTVEHRTAIPTLTPADTVAGVVARLTAGVAAARPASARAAYALFARIG